MTFFKCVVHLNLALQCHNFIVATVVDLARREHVLLSFD